MINQAKWIVFFSLVLYNTIVEVKGMHQTICKTSTPYIMQNTTYFLHTQNFKH